MMVQLQLWALAQALACQLHLALLRAAGCLLLLQLTSPPQGPLSHPAASSVPGRQPDHSKGMQQRLQLLLLLPLGPAPLPPPRPPTAWGLILLLQLLLQPLAMLDHFHLLTPHQRLLLRLLGTLAKLACTLHLTPIHLVLLRLLLQAVRKSVIDLSPHHQATLLLLHCPLQLLPHHHQQQQARSPVRLQQLAWLLP